ncbi:MAG: hypothetical protein WAW41_05545, partial [Methylobacter sp.]
MDAGGRATQGAVAGSFANWVPKPELSSLYTSVYGRPSFRQGLPESTTARMQEVEQCMEQLPRAQGCERLI